MEAENPLIATLFIEKSGLIIREMEMAPPDALKVSPTN